MPSAITSCSISAVFVSSCNFFSRPVSSHLLQPFLLTPCFNMASSTPLFAPSLPLRPLRRHSPSVTRSSPRFRAAVATPKSAKSTNSSLPSKSPSNHTSSSSISEPTQPETKLFDALVIGAGPAGLSLSSALCNKGLSVACADPNLGNAWPNHYGVWEDEFGRVGLAHCATKRYRNTSIFVHNERTLVNRPYIRVDRVKLKETFVQNCEKAGVVFLEDKVVDVEHVCDQWSLIQMNGGEISDFRARIVVDCTGHALQFTSGKESSSFEKPWEQAAYGIEAIVKDYPFEKDEMVLMDFRDNHAKGAMKAASIERPTFLYVFPMSENRAFFEETSVIAPTAVPFEELKERLHARLKHEGIEIERVVEEEFSLIPMGGSLPKQGRIVGFGGAAGLVHPATGYMVARTVNLAEKVASAIANGLEEVGVDGSMEAVARKGWQVSWNTAVLRQRDFLNFGSELLLQLDIEESREFFDAFFRLPRDLWTRFLSYELDTAGRRALFALTFFLLTTNEIRIRLLRGIIDIGQWKLIRSVLPTFLTAWQEE